MIDTYTRLLEAEAESLEKAAADAAVTKLIMHLKSSGRLQSLPRVARELEKVAARRIAFSPRVEAASAGEVAAALRAAAEEGIVARRATVNPSLIRGWRARGGGTLVDRSAKQALIAMYQKITA